MAQQPTARRGPIRRVARGIADTIAMAGIAGMGSGQTRGSNNVQTRSIADSALQTFREVGAQSEQARARWSIAGALALVILGILTLAGSMTVANAILSALGLAQIVTAAATALTTARHAAQGSVVHLVGGALAAISIYVSLPVFMSLGSEALAVTALLLAIGAIVGLVAGRR